jgi:hypothetical protein
LVSQGPPKPAHGVLPAFGKPAASVAPVGLPLERVTFQTAQTELMNCT